MARTTTLIAALLATIVSVSSSANAQQWGTLKGRFVYEGTAPKPPKINLATSNDQYCKNLKTPLFVESLLVDAKGGLAGVAVYIRQKRGSTLKIHPDYAAAAKSQAVLDNTSCHFVPHVLVMRTSQELLIKNSDATGHNTNISSLRNPPFNTLIPANGNSTHRFKVAESLPIGVVCNIHPWMKSFVLVRNNPYMTITGSDGSFEISNLPAGKHEFVFWHESKGNLKKVSLGEAGKTNRKGRAKLEIPAGGTLDLGDVKIAPAVLGL